MPQIYHAFDPLEMEVLLAHIYGYQHIQVPVRDGEVKEGITSFKFIPLPRTTDEFDLRRPYTPVERFVEAVKAMVVGKGIKFPNMKFHANENKIEAIGLMDDKRAKESKRLYQSLLDWDEEVLKSCVSGRGGRVNEKLGFSRSAAPGLTIEMTIGDLESIAGEEAKPGESGGEGTIGQILEDGTLPRKPGRHANDCACFYCKKSREKEEVK